MMPNPSYEVDHLDKEYKGRNGTPEGVSKPDVFGVVAITPRRVTHQHCREGDFTGAILPPSNAGRLTQACDDFARGSILRLLGPQSSVLLAITKLTARLKTRSWRRWR